jgi:AcrR family transcriptional regulator
MTAVDPTEIRAKAYHVGNVRTTLLVQAGALLREGGLPNLNLRALSARTGVALSSVYHHFGSKSELLAALAVQGFEDLSGKLQAARNGGGDRIVRACVMAHFDFAWDAPELYSLMFSVPIARSPEVAAARQAAFEVLQGGIAAAAVRLDRPRETVPPITVAVWTCVHGAASLAPIQEEGHRLAETMISGLEALFLGARQS